jgi:hypothetical protein
MELSPSSEVASYASSQEFSNIFWNPEVYYRVRKSPPLDPVLSHINLVYTSPFDRTSPRPFVTFHSNIIFDDEELLAPRPTTKLEGHPLSADRDCLFNIFASYRPHLESISIRNLRTQRAVLTRDPRNMAFTHALIQSPQSIGTSTGSLRGHAESL